MDKYKLSRVAVVGGGPAGSFFALYLLKYARDLGLSLTVHIYESKDFDLPGPHGCNRCAGVLSNSLLENLKDLELTIPDEVIQSRISVYSLCSPFGNIEIANPSMGQQIYSVYRGGGPLHSSLPGHVSFDGFLLRKAEERGAVVVPQRVSALRFITGPAVGVDDIWEEYDLVVLAAGVNSVVPGISGLDYLPPSSQRMIQDELLARPEDVRKAFGDSVKVFVIPSSELIFGSLVPKGSYINVSLLSKSRSPSIEEFLSHPLVKAALPFPYQRTCGCKPRISMGMAKNPVGEGFAAVGDAACARLYKDGIGSALLTSRRAAYTAAHFGASKGAFRSHYVPLLEQLHRDNLYGRFLFSVHNRLKRSPAYFSAQAQLIVKERSSSASRPYHKAMWGMFTGSYSYKEIMSSALRPSFASRLTVEAARQQLRGTTLPPKHILILGGGFAGVYTAIHLEKALRRQKAVEVTLMSKENFFLFTPLLHEVATGGIETRHIAYPLRSLKGRRRISFVRGEVQGIDLKNNLVFSDSGNYHYDYLVLALGSVTDTTQLEGQFSHVFTLKDIYDGMSLRNHLISLFERADACPEDQARLLTMVVLGGGSTGVQLIAEMRDFVAHSLGRHYPRLSPDVLRFILVQNGDRLLEGMDSGLAGYATSVLKRKGIEMRFQSRITRLLPDAVEVNGAEVIPTATVVLAAGIRSNPVVESLPVAKDSIGRIKVNGCLEVPDVFGVYALGDNALFLSPKTGQPMPARAHVAVRQAKSVARSILADLNGKPKRPCPAPWMAETVSLGSREAGLKIWKLRLYGFPARFLWLISYLLIVPSVYVRTRVLIDWMMALVFGRDTTLLRLGASDTWKPTV